MKSNRKQRRLAFRYRNYSRDVGNLPENVRQALMIVGIEKWVNKGVK